MFEDIIGETRLIEVLHVDGTWKLDRMKNLKLLFIFRYVDRPEVHWRVMVDPFKADDVWTVIGEVVED